MNKGYEGKKRKKKAVKMHDKKKWGSRVKQI